MRYLQGNSSRLNSDKGQFNLVYLNKEAMTIIMSQLNGRSFHNTCGVRPCNIKVSIIFLVARAMF